MVNGDDDEGSLQIIEPFTPICLTRDSTILQFASSWNDLPTSPLNRMNWEKVVDGLYLLLDSVTVRLSVCLVDNLPPATVQFLAHGEQSVCL